MDRTDTLAPARRPAGRARLWPLSHVTPRIGAMTSSPAMMRPYARAILTEWGMPDIAEDTELIVSELVTNVAVAPPAGDQDGYRVPEFQLGLYSDRAGLLIEVFDTVPGMPEQRAAGTDDEHGRGLEIVEALSEQWGTHRRPGGKIVWARLTRTAVLRNEGAAR